MLLVVFGLLLLCVWAGTASRPFLNLLLRAADSCFAFSDSPPGLNSGKPDSILHFVNRFNPLTFARCVVWMASNTAGFTIQPGLFGLAHGGLTIDAQDNTYVVGCTPHARDSLTHIVWSVAHVLRLSFSCARADLDMYLPSPLLVFVSC